MAVTHDHSSPFYTSTAWGAWAFQDVFDIRAYEYWATKIADAVEKANRQLVPVRVGASVTKVASVNRNASGPAVADDGTPAGFPDSYTDRDYSLLRFDDISDPAAPKPLANVVDVRAASRGHQRQQPDHRRLHRRRSSASWTAARAAMTMFTQGSTGNSEPERSAYHSVHDRFTFSHQEYAQGRVRRARQIADAGYRLWQGIGSGTPEPGEEARFVPFCQRRAGRVRRPLAGRAHQPPVPGGVQLPHRAGAPRQPAAAGHRPARLPEPAARVRRARGPRPLNNPGITIDDLKDAGIPIPDNYGVPVLHRRWRRTSASTSRRSGSATSSSPCARASSGPTSPTTSSAAPTGSAGNQWQGFDWATYRGLDANGIECFEVPPYDGSRWSCPNPETATKTPCFQEAGGTWSCPNPKTACLLDGDAFANTCRDAAGNPGLRDSRLSGITDHEFRAHEGPGAQLRQRLERRRATS